MCSCALDDYLAAFADPGEPFLTHYTFAPDRSVTRRRLTRGELWSLGRRAASVLRRRGVGEGQCVIHHFTANRPEDLAFRLGATMVGAVPVTVNWQADTGEQIAFKVRCTDSRLIAADAGVAQDQLSVLCGLCAGVAAVRAEDLPAAPEMPDGEMRRSADLGHDAVKMVIFTSGTTGRPKGVRLTYGNYATNALTFQSFLNLGDADALDLLIVNPLHHANSTAMTDWALRRPHARVHMVERYATAYWTILAEVGRAARGMTVAPLVSRHFDYLENLRQEGKLPVGADELRDAMRRVRFLLGSAPVGPTTVQRVVDWAGRLPLVRFGSTETCLQVLGTPPDASDGQGWEAFRRGWEHTWKGEPACGYYIGRPHPPHTEVRVVRSVRPEESDHFVDCVEGEPGQLIARGGNVMAGYVGDEAATRAALRPDGWYTGLGDVCFWLAGGAGGGRDYYWMSRESALLIRGGANYSCAQVSAELASFLAARYRLPEGSFDVAVAGLRVASEHEDSCCVTVELISEEALGRRAEIERTFLTEARTTVSKGARPDRLRIAPIPRNFKGAVVFPELKKACLLAVETGEDIVYDGTGDGGMR